MVKATLKRIKVLKMACYMGLISFLGGVIYVIFQWITNLILSPILGTPSFTDAFGFVFFVVVPFGFGIVMFLMTLVFVPLSNLVLKWIKGLEFEFEFGEQVPVPKVTKPVRPAVSKPATSKPTKLLASKPVRPAAPATPQVQKKVQIPTLPYR